MTPSQNGYLPTVECLIKYGADVNQRNKAGETALKIATNHRHSQIREFLLSKGATE